MRRHHTNRPVRDRFPHRSTGVSHFTQLRVCHQQALRCAGSITPLPRSHPILIYKEVTNRQHFCCRRVSVVLTTVRARNLIIKSSAQVQSSSPCSRIIIRDATAPRAPSIAHDGRRPQWRSKTLPSVLSRQSRMTITEIRCRRCGTIS